MLKPRWETDSYGRAKHAYKLGRLHVGEVHPLIGDRYRGWIWLDDEGEAVSEGVSIDEARSAVEMAVEDALGGDLPADERGVCDEDIFDYVENGGNPIPDSLVRYEYEHDGKTEVDFEAGNALASLLMAEVVFINSRHWREHDKENISVLVNCSDVFAWGCADAEDLPYAEIERLYDMYRTDPLWGPAVWCILQRGEMPQKPVEERIRKGGIWNLDSLNLKENETAAWVEAQMAKAAARLRERQS